MRVHEAHLLVVWMDNDLKLLGEHAHGLKVLAERTCPLQPVLRSADFELI